ncbi:8-amino-7-oxononanoate synthase [Sessilibacter sp. MAH4]
MTIEQQLTQALLDRHEAHLYRQRKVLLSAQNSRVQVNAQHYLNFASNDYLGLANHPDVITAFTEAAARYGVGSGASHMVIGHHEQHHLLEQELAEFTGRERALLFANGYAANLACLNVLLGQGDLVAEDKLNHASLLDGGLSSGAKFRRYLHCDLNSLEKMLTPKANRKIVVTDGVFSMDGDLAPLREISQICQQHNAWLMVDDAHGFGVLGATGAGLCEAENLSANDVPVLMGTLGKAFGTYGAFVAGSETLIETLIQFARPYIYSTALPPAVAAATRQSLKIIREGTGLRTHLAELIRVFREKMQKTNLELLTSHTAIQPIIIGDQETTLKVAQWLQEQGVLVGAIRPPTVPAGTARLRVTLTASHSLEDIDSLVNLLIDANERFVVSSAR